MDNNTKKKRKHFLNKNILSLSFFIPVILISLRKLIIENDTCFLLNHGKYVIEHGFPRVEPFTIHQNFSFVMQQWLSSVIFYLSDKWLGKYGLWIILEVVACLIMYFLYKLCMKLSDNKVCASTLFTVLTVSLLVLFIVPRPQIFTYLFLIVILYIMELFYDNPKTKSIYFLPLVSLLQINFHASMWFMMYIFMLPYIVSSLYDSFKYKNNNSLVKLLLIVFMMFLAGFINPYGIDAITYIFDSYGNFYVHRLGPEMYPVSLDSSIYVYYPISLLVIMYIFSIIAIYIFYKKGKLQLRHFFLLYGTIFLALSNLRNVSLLIIGTIPFILSYTKDLFKNELGEGYCKKTFYIIIKTILVITTVIIFKIVNVDITSPLKRGVDKILENNSVDDVILYTNQINGSYAEYRGLRPYIDGRAEVFLKSKNHKEDILKEYYELRMGSISYNCFISKYNFTHMIISKNERIFDDAIKDKNYKIIYKDKSYYVFERKM